MSNGIEAYFQCDSCGKRYRWDPSLAGQKIPCGGCGHTMRVPKTEPVAREPEDRETIPLQPAEGDRAGRRSAESGNRSERDRHPGRRRERSSREDSRPRSGGPGPTPEKRDDDHGELDAIELADEEDTPAGEGVECPSCGAPIPAGRRVCPQCGLNLYTGEKVKRKRRGGGRGKERRKREPGEREHAAEGRRRRRTGGKSDEAGERGGGRERGATAAEPEGVRVYRKREWQIPLYMTAAGLPLLLLVKYLQIAGGDYGAGGIAAEFGWLTLGCALGILILTGAGLLSGFLLDHDFGPLDTVFLKFAAAYLSAAVVAGVIVLPIGPGIEAGWVEVNGTLLSLAIGVPVFALVAMGLMMWFFDASAAHAGLAAFICLFIGAMAQVAVPATALFAFLVQTASSGA